MKMLPVIATIRTMAHLDRDFICFGLSQVNDLSSTRYELVILCALLRRALRLPVARPGFLYCVLRAHHSSQLISCIQK